MGTTAWVWAVPSAWLGGWSRGPCGRGWRASGQVAGSGSGAGSEDSSEEVPGLTLPLLQTIIDILEWSNQKKLQQLTRELKEWEEKEESKIKCENPGGELPIPSLAPGRSAAHPPCTCLLETSSPIISLLRQMGRRDCSPILQMGKLKLKKVKVARQRAGSREPESSPSFLRFLPRSLWESVAGPGPRSSIMLSLWFLSREQTGSPLRDGVVCQRASDPGTPPPTEGGRTDFLLLVVLWLLALGASV